MIYLPEMHQRMGSDSGLWLRRPLAADLLEYAAADVAGLLPLAERLRSDLQVGSPSCSLKGCMMFYQFSGVVISFEEVSQCLLFAMNLVVLS